MKIRLPVFLLVGIAASFVCFARQTEVNSLLDQLKQAKADTAKVNLLNAISKQYFNTSPKDAISYALQARDLAGQLQYQAGSALALKNAGIGYYMQSDYLEATTYWGQALKVYEEINDKAGIANMLSNMGAVYINQGDDEKALDYNLRSLQYAEATGDTLRLVTAMINIGAVYFNKPATHGKALDYYLRALPLCEALEDQDAIGTITSNLGEIFLAKGDDSSALVYFERSLKAYENSGNIPYALNNLGKVYDKRGDYTTAISCHLKAYDIASKLAAKLDMTQSYLGLATTYALKGDLAKALDAYQKAEGIAKEIGANYELKTIYEGLASTYARLYDYANAYRYEVLYAAVKDTLYNSESDKKLAMLQFNFDLQKKQAEIDHLTTDKALKELDLDRQTTVKNSLIAVLSLVSLIVFILFRNYRIQSKTNTKLDIQKQELEQTLKELKTTQSQLIQSEKMASLGELTAGIAHEIQNPLNFVNNFSEVSIELAQELLSGINNTALSAKEKEDFQLLVQDLVDNQEKINFHGKRADAIVKGMLQHSRSGTGKKEAVEINNLADEYLRLSYHGLKAKEKAFNTALHTDFDEHCGNVQAIPQELGRVLLNIFNNAFYSVEEKKKIAGEGYSPLVSLTTKRKGNFVEITIRDNGLGIPQKYLDKVFQPFFTTKPAGKGTGLGLSLSYEIITKGHGGELKVDTKEGEYAAIIIRLPA